MLHTLAAKECLATEPAPSKFDEAWCEPDNNTDRPSATVTRALPTTAGTHHQHKHLDQTPLLQECRAVLVAPLPSGQSGAIASCRGRSEGRRAWRRASYLNEV